MSTRTNSHNLARNGFCVHACDQCDRIIETRTLKVAAREMGTNPRLIGR